MKILGLGVPELVIILVVVLLIFGPKNPPKLGSAIGKGVKSLRNGLAGDKEETADEVVEEVVIEKVEKLESASEEQAAKPKVKRVVKKVAAE